jgi:BlaI family penicillinase repressor
MPPPRVSLAESRIMEAFWREGALSAEGVIAAVGAEQGWAPGTVRTLIARLLKKGMIVATRDDGQHSYRPLVPRDKYVRAESQGLVDRLFGGEVTPLVAHFAEHRALSPSDIRDLKALIAKLADE